MRRASSHFGVVLTVFLGICVISASVGVSGKTESPRTYAQDERVSTAAVTKPAVEGSVALQVATSNLDAIGVTRLRAELGVSGLGQTLAVIDTGVDPRVFGGLGPKASNRVIDWIDLTGEGSAVMIGQYSSEAGTVHLGEIPLDVRTVKSRSGKYIVGLLPDVVAAKLDGGRTVYFVVSDPDIAGVYNTVSVDTDSDLNFAGEVSLREFRADRSYAVLEASPEQSLGLVVSRVDVADGAVMFGFDLNGHGTGLAAIAAGSGVMPGVAPEGRVLVVKALKSDGLGEWGDIEKGILEAVTAKASVVLVGSAKQQASEDSQWDQLQSELASMSSHLVLPVGNAGPGVGTVTVTADSDATVLVSGYLPEASANALMGDGFAADAWYPLASCGPDPEGGRGPMISAPAVSAVPSFRGNGELTFSMMEGTSVSAAYAAGTLALIRQTQSDATGRLAKVLSFVTAALSQGASRMPGVLPAEQGAGRLDVNATWAILRSRPDHRRMLLVADWDDSSSSSGIWIEGTTPGAFPVWVDNYAPTARIADLACDASWLRTRSERLLMEPVSQRDNVVYGTEELVPGFYSTEITADDPATAGVDASFSVNVSIPQQFSTSGTMSFTLGSETGQQVARQFIQMPQTAESAELSISGTGRGLHFVIYNPDGILVRHGSLDGDVTTRIGLPAPGLWQVCVFAPGAGAAPVSARVEASLRGFYGTDLGATLQSQFYMVRPEGDRVTLRAASADKTSEYRHRRSFAQQTGRSNQLMLPDIGGSVGALSVRFGTVTGNVLRVYLMHFDPLTSKWSEVGRALTTTTGAGEIHLPNPQPGKYAVYAEAYGVGTQVYVEMDVNYLAKDGVADLDRDLPKSVAEGMSTLQIPLREEESESRLLLILRQSDSHVVGVLERPLVKASEIPIVQVSGGPDLKTIRAWQRSDMAPVDALVSIGARSYQLTGGRVTAPIADGSNPSLRTAEGSRVLLFSPKDQ